MGIRIEGAFGGGGTPPVPTDESQNSILISGGQVVWESAYTFRVAAAVYEINGTQHSSPETVVTLDSAHATLDRFDVIVVTSSGTADKVTGTAAAQPSEPDIDAGTQLKLALILVTHNTSEPVGVTSVLLYADHAGSPTEWNWTASGASINVNSSNNPRAGTKSIEGTNVVAGVYAQGQIGSGSFDPNLYNYLVLFVRSKASWAASRGLTISLRSSNVLVGSAVTIRNTATWGFDSSVTGSYQVIAIPIVNFGVTAGLTINQVRIADFGGAIGFYIDDISFQGNFSVAQAPADLNAKFVTGAPQLNLPNAIVIPSIVIHADIKGLHGEDLALEFEDNSTILTWVDESNAAATPDSVDYGTIDKSHVVITDDRASPNILYGLTPFAPPAGYDVRMKLGIQTKAGGGSSTVGLVIASSNIASRLLVLINDFWGVSAFSNLNNGGYVSIASAFTAHTPMYYRIVRAWEGDTANQGRIMTSFDGISWRDITGVFSFAFTPTQVGVRISPVSVVTTAKIDWIRGKFL